jgi:hypothetical protein
MKVIIFNKVILICFLFSSLNIVFGQNSNIENYQNDLILLKKSFETNYPSLYRFNSKTSIDKLFYNSSVNINNKTTDRNFYKNIKFILSKIEDGHLSCNPSESLLNQFDAKEKFFPLTLYFIDEKAFIDCSNANMLSPGTEILEINNEKINSIRKNIFNYIVSDGKIETKKYWVLNRYFWIYYNVVYGQQEKFQVKYKEQNGNVSIIEVHPNFKKNIECKSLLKKEQSQLLNLQYPNSNTALLTIQTFSLDELSNAKLDFNNFLESSFKDLKQKKSTSLIIDLRGNGGGRDVFGSLLYSYLTNKSFQYYKTLQTSTKILTETDHPNLALQKPNPTNFDGRVYIIINGLSFSVTSEFCTIAKNNNRAVFIGEETGGTYCGNTSGDFTDIILPFSKIDVSIPTTKYTMFVTDKNNKDRGILPDYLIKPTIKNLINKEDVQLNLALKLAENNKLH